jgi:hypothetical protein
MTCQSFIYHGWSASPRAMGTRAPDLDPACRRAGLHLSTYTFEDQHVELATDVAVIAPAAGASVAAFCGRDSSTFVGPAPTWTNTSAITFRNPPASRRQDVTPPVTRARPHPPADRRRTAHQFDDGIVESLYRELARCHRHCTSGRGDRPPHGTPALVRLALPAACLRAAGRVHDPAHPFLLSGAYKKAARRRRGRTPYLHQLRAPQAPPRPTPPTRAERVWATPQQILRIAGQTRTLGGPPPAW